MCTAPCDTGWMLHDAGLSPFTSNIDDPDERSPELIIGFTGSGARTPFTEKLYVYSAGRSGPTVMLQIPSAALVNALPPVTKSPDTLTLVASGARTSKI